MNIDILSIILTDSTGVDVYTLGDDYTITEINGRVRLNIIIPGFIFPSITDGQEILVDYDHFLDPEREDETLRQNFTIRQRFNNGLSLYYWHQRQDKNVSSNVTKITPDEFRTNTFGVDFTRKGLSLSAEHSEEDSTQVSSTSDRLEARYNWFLNNSRTRISMYVTKNWLSFGEPDSRDIELLRVGGELLSKLTKKYDISASVAFRDEQDSIVGNTEGIQFDTELRYNFRRLSIRTGIEYGFLERRGSEFTNTLLYFRLKRTF